MDFKQAIGEKIAKVLNMPVDEVVSGIEVPTRAKMGDYSYPCFRLKPILGKEANAIASEICENMEKPSCVNEIEVVSGYVNFRLNKEMVADTVMKTLMEKGENYGKSTVGEGKTVVIDYSSPNIAKPFHVGHLRTTVIGKALYNTHKFLGYKVVGINHLGDWGTQFGKMIVAVKNWGDNSVIEEKGIREIARLYARFHVEAENDKSLNDEARSWLLKMQEGDDEALGIWKWLCDISMRELNDIYDRLHVNFDYFTGESFYNDKMDAIVDELKQKKLLVESEGAQVVDLEESGMPPCLILRSDGGTLYPTRDISAAKYRQDTFGFHKCLYVTGLEQNLHFAQWFKVIDLMGYDWAKGLVHIPYGLVSLKEGKLSTRRGNVIFMEDLLNEAVARTLEIINEKNPTLENKQEVAEQVGIGAIVFNDLYNSRVKDVVFNWEKMLNFEGETGPYVQYTIARANSVLKKGDFAVQSNCDFSILNDDASFECMKLLYNYPDKLIESAEKYEPYIISRHLVNIAQAFNYFYHENPILSSEGDLKQARLSLVYAVREVLKAGLGLIGIDSPEQM